MNSHSKKRNRLHDLRIIRNATQNVYTNDSYLSLDVCMYDNKYVRIGQVGIVGAV
jgi:hypothetical protein